MLELKNVVKDYVSAAGVTHALKGINLNFRKNEFVSILGQSGCGKTTMLNIIGGLDRYTSGDLLINGKSTIEYKDRDWDTYRNHSIGFVFQTYNLIAHESVLGNVELSLTIAGVSKKERHERAVEALKKVGLEESINKSPNQLSGGQMQRVAIARALINNPEILLADEPTGALDSDTSLQIMELLKEIAKDRLVVMVTHNPELAAKYSTRIIKLSDGLIISDSNPFDGSGEVFDNAIIKKVNKGSKKKSSMSFWTALNLSFRNLLSKKGRTILIAFAGSIGIIGIALVLGLSDGFNGYVNQVQSDTLSRYPLSINRTEMSVTSFMSLAGTEKSDSEEYPTGDVVYSNDILTTLLETVNQGYSSNDLKSFKTYLDSDEFKQEYGKYYSAIQYVYDVDLETYSSNSEGVYEKDYPVDYSFLGQSRGGPFQDALVSLMQSSYVVYDELIDNQDLLNGQYDVLAGQFPQNKDEIVVVVDEYNRINDYVLYALGVKDERADYEIIQNGGEVEPYQGTFEDMLNLSYKLPLLADTYVKDEITQKYDASNDTAYVQQVYADAPEVRVVGVLRQKESSTTASVQGGIGYTKALTDDLINRANATSFVIDQKASDTNIIAPTNQLAYLPVDTVLTYFGSSDLNNPSMIKIYPTSFTDKTYIINMIDSYNTKVEAAGHVEQKITYTDTVGTLMSSVSVIVTSVTYVLIAFVSISLIVSSIMIGIITYVSVIERTKEIGVLRSLGASKRDVGNIFNAETLIIGLLAGVFGIGISLILIFPMNAIIGALTGISGLAFLNWYWCLALIAISMILTLIAGSIPSSIAAKRDPVVALRTGE